MAGVKLSLGLLAASYAAIYVGLLAIGNPGVPIIPDAIEVVLGWLGVILGGFGLLEGLGIKLMG